MKETKLDKQKKNLVELGVMEESDTLIDFFQASYIERLIGKWGQWKKGWAYFTEKRLIVTTGLLEKTLLFPMKISGHWKNAHRALCRLGLPLLMRTRRTVKS